MPIVINTNTAATTASFNLSKANDSLRKSLGRLSSGNRIVSPADDAGGLAVAYKLASKLNRTEAVRTNVQNGVSYLQVQDGALSTVGKIIDRMAELRTMAQDVTKNTGDIENYSKEFIELQRQLQQIKNDTFNGISLFANSAALASGSTPSLRPHLAKDSTAVDDAGRTFSKFSRTLYTHADGQFADGNVSLGVTNMQYVLSLGGVDTKYVSTAVSAAIAGASQNINLGNINSLNTTDDAALIASIYTSDGFLSSIMFVSVGQFTNVIERLADARAENGAELSRLNMTNELLIQNQTNLEAAHGRIMDADIALESTRFARQNVLVQASAAMVAQANQLTSIALQILG
ncbi:MAG: flagellin [Verrucomicrobia bacterium]|nr:flagellin [Verrucomicrobiota bacterium]